MTLAITHAHVSAIADDGSDVGSNAWNAAHTLTGTVSVAQGGTGLTTFTQGDIIYASAANTLAALADAATGNALISGGVSTAPSWGKVGLTTHVSGTLPIANGGTNATTLTSNAIDFFNGTSIASMSGTSWDDTNRSLTLTGATVTANNPILNLSQTWNNAAVAFTAIKLAVTNTANLATTSLLMDLQRASAVSAFSVGVDGGIQGNFSINGNAVCGVKTSTFAVGATATDCTVFLGNDAIGGFGAIARSDGYFGWSSSTNAFTGTYDLKLIRPAAATLQQGAPDAAAPVAQTTQVQSVVAGTTNTAGVDWTIQGSRGTGTGAGGNIIFKTAPAGTTGSAQNAGAEAFRVRPDGTIQVKQFTVATLPTAGTAGRIASVSDANATTFNSTVAGGGTNKVMVFDNGTNWVIA